LEASDLNKEKGVGRSPSCPYNYSFPDCQDHPTLDFEPFAKCMVLNLVLDKHIYPIIYAYILQGVLMFETSRFKSYFYPNRTQTINSNLFISKDILELVKERKGSSQIAFWREQK
jgi:hypothetical protein